jgi:hypothetical protein
VTIKYSKSTLASALAPAVGEEKAQELVSEAMRELGVHSRDVTAYEARALFDHLGRHEGVVGVSARIAKARLASLRDSENPGSSKHRRITANDVIELLSPSVGQERARELVEASCHKLSIDPEVLGRDDVSAVLDDLAMTGGVVSVVARFAKARALLKFA